MTVFCYPDGESTVNSVIVTPHPIKVHKKNELKLLYEWKEIIYAYPSPAAEKEDIKNGIYKPGHPFPVDVDAYYPGINHNKYLAYIHQGIS